MYAEERLKAEVIQEAMKKSGKASERKSLAKEVVNQNKMPISQACRAFCVSESCYRYQPMLTNENQLIAD